MVGTGIYITGLGQSFNNETVEKYAERVVNELKFNTTGIDYLLEVEKKTYGVNNRETTLVNIYKTDWVKPQELVYRLYDFKYHEILTERFNKNNILIKSSILLTLVIKKIPQVVKRLFIRDGYTKPYLALYAFVMLLIVSMSIFFLFPAIIDVLVEIIGKVTHLFDTGTVEAAKATLPKENSTMIEGVLTTLKDFSRTVSPIIAFIIILIPQSQTMVTTMATEFACVDNYIVNGEQSQIVLGHLDALVDHVTEQNRDSRLHFHCYSFGSLLAMDYLFPITQVIRKDTMDYTDVLITIGNPYEFINSYYPNFYSSRYAVMQDKLTWLNIYSISDALATNFRKDEKKAEAQFGIKEIPLKPVNLNYEPSQYKPFNLYNFLSFHSIRVHKCYWDSSPSGQSCMGILVPYMMQNKMLQA